MYCLNTKIRLTMLCLSGFELYTRCVPPIFDRKPTIRNKIHAFSFQSSPFINKRGTFISANKQLS